MKLRKIIKLYLQQPDQESSMTLARQAVKMLSFSIFESGLIRREIYRRLSIRFATQALLMNSVSGRKSWNHTILKSDMRTIIKCRGKIKNDLEFIFDAIRHCNLNISPRLLVRIKGYACHYCNVETKCQTKTQTIVWNYEATIDHLVPRSRGGTFNMDNLVIACRECNYHKSNMSEVDFRQSKWLKTKIKHLTE